MRDRLPVIALVFAGLLLIAASPVIAQDLRTGIEKIAEEIIEKAPEDRKLRVAVADFPDLLNITSNLGRYIANRLTTRLAQSPKFFVVERQRLSQVLGELKFSMTDLVDPEKAKQLGKMVGVEAVVVGTVSDLGNQVDLDARVIEIETSRMISSASTTISKDQVVSQLMERGRTAALTQTSTTPPGTQLQSQQPIAVTHASGSRPVASSDEPSTPSYQNSFLRVRPKSISKSDDKKTVSLVLNFENLTEKDLFLTIKRHHDKFFATLVDNKGITFYLSRVSGIASASVPYGQQGDKNNYSLFTPGALFPVVMVFTSEKESEGDVFSFSADCFRYEDKSYMQFAIGITNMNKQ